jgi:soluble lytic murein transglycosylase-like protein
MVGKSFQGKFFLGALLITLAFIASVPRESKAFCFDEAGQTYGVPPSLLWAIAKVESGFDPGAVCYNDDGSYDYGVMQINSSWAARLGLKVWNTLDDPCTNVKVGAWILSDCLTRYGYTWEGIGCYNAVSLDKRADYARKVIDLMNRMRETAPGKTSRK